MPKGSFFIETLGCPKNLVDSEKLKYTLKQAGLQEAPSPEQANYIIVNTCTFIRDAKEETIEKVLTLARDKRPEQKLIMFGCMVQRYGEILKKELHEVDYFVGLSDRDSLFQFLNLTGTSNDTIEYEPETFPYAYIKIAEGCQRHCSFCVIPSIRGPLKSIPPEKILQQSEYLLSRGYKELILVAQDITSYGQDLKRGYGLRELLRDLNCINGQFWIRLLYLYPTSVDEALLETIASSKKVCPYLDIPLQHTHQRLLSLMGRAGNSQKYMDLIQKARSIIPQVHLRTSLIVGFPTETEEEFQAMLQFVQEVEFDHLGAFVYSDEEGTRAFSLQPKVAEEIAQQRYALLMETQARISREKLSRYIGKRIKVLVDSVEEEFAIGRHSGQAPEIDGIVIIQNPDGLLEGQFVDVLIEDTTTYDLIGRLQ